MIYITSDIVVECACSSA